LPKTSTQNSKSLLGFQTGGTTGKLPEGIDRGARLTNREQGVMRARQIGQECHVALGTPNTAGYLGVTSVKGVGSSHGNVPRCKNAKEHRTSPEGKIRMNVRTVHARLVMKPVAPETKEQTKT
jgi:hypothetical protein